MSHKTQPETKSHGEQVPLQSARNKAARVLDRLVRVLLCLAVAVGTVYCLLRVEQMRTSTSPKQIQVSLGPSSTEPLLPLMDAIQGNWQFAGIPWTVQSQELNPAEAIARLSEPAWLENVGDQADEVTELLQTLLDMLGATPTFDSDRCVYHIESSAFIATAFAPRERPRQIQLVRVAQILGEETANFAELRRDMAESVSDASDGRLSLLPAHPDNIRLALRRDGQGTLTAELIQLRTDLDRVQSLWKQAGWTLTPQHGALPSSSSLLAGADVATALLASGNVARRSSADVQQDTAATTTLLASRGDDAVLAIVIPDSAQLPATLFLVHAPK